jgi:hypothetical protein
LEKNVKHNEPNIHFYTVNRVQGSGANEETFFEIYMVDSKTNIPVTSNEWNKGKSPPRSIKKNNNRKKKRYTCYKIGTFKFFYKKYFFDSQYRSFNENSFIAKNGRK